MVVNIFDVVANIFIENFASVLISEVCSSICLVPSVGLMAGQ